MIWKSNKKVGFGTKGRWVVAWYCGGEKHDTTAAHVKNVFDICIVDKYNKCYNDMALKYHNEKRALHKDTKFLIINTSISKKIQAEMDKAGFAGTIKTENKGSFGTCGETIYTEKVAAKVKDVLYTNAASTFWYAGETEYDYTKGEPKKKTDKNKKAYSDNFTKMVWKATTKVGFGVKGKYVIAWYCEATPNTGSTTEFKKNVGEKCVNAAKINVCFNVKQVTSHNEKRV